MHPEAKAFIAFVKQILPDAFIDKRVLDVGSADINGNNREVFERCDYIGNDVFPWKNVSVVSKTKDLEFPSASFDTIVSTECFEHDPEYADSWRKIYDLLKPGGVFCFTCASTGRKEHGTQRESPGDSLGTIGGFPEMQDYYKNLTVQELYEVFQMNDAFSTWDAYYNAKSHDLYFIGVKCGTHMVKDLQKYTGISVSHVASGA